MSFQLPPSATALISTPDGDLALAELYDPLTMPPALVKAHQKLDRAVDAAHGYRGKSTDAERVAFLFELYQKYTSLFPAEKPTRGRGRRATQGARPGVGSTP